LHELKQKVAYLQGLTKGLNVSGQSAEGKLLTNVIDVLEDIAEELHDMDLAQVDLENYVETIDEDLTDLEEEVYDIDAEEDDELVEVECPVCHEVITFESDVLNDDDVVEVTCPTCGEVVYENTIEFAADDDMITITMMIMTT
jgi:endogenous inhibitor of DNA gyrase (YacG/DUF329 family)